jgi:DNA-binding MarR family transcriptional regulator
LQSLASKKLIAKKPDSFDSRVIVVSLTGKGRLAAERAMGVVRQTYSTIMNGVDEKLANELITTLETNLHSILSQLRSGQKSVVGPTCDAPV